MKTTLYEIADNYRAFMQMVDSGELDNIACLYKSMSAEADAIEAEARHLLERAKYKRNVCDRLKNYVAQQMQSIGQDRFENERNRITFSKSTALSVIDENALFNALQLANRDDLYAVEKVTTFDKKGIKKALKDGNTFAGCELKTNKNLQIK